MSQFYVGVKQVFAYPEERDGKPGYHIVYDYQTPQEYHSWSPADKFESAYLPMGESNDGSKITHDMVSGFVDFQPTYTHGTKTTVVAANMKNGFEVVESSSCVDVKNYSEEIGGEICRERITDQVWHLLGFVLQWARNGIKGA